MGPRRQTRFYQVVFDYNATSATQVARADPGLDQRQVVDGNRSTVPIPACFSMPEGDPVDYQQNDLGWRLCSAKMKGIIENREAEDDVLVWLRATVTSRSGTESTYFLLQFPTPLPQTILDRRRTVYNENRPDHVIKPALKHSELGHHKVFTYQGGFEPWFVSADIRDALLFEDCKRIEFIER